MKSGEMLLFLSKTRNVPVSRIFHILTIEVQFFFSRKIKGFGRRVMIFNERKQHVPAIRDCKTNYGRMFRYRRSLNIT